MGEKAQEALKLQFNRRLRLEFHGSKITSDAGLLACRELDGALGLTEIAPIYLRETRGGRNVQHELVPLLRQSVYSRLAGYEDTSDAVRLARDPAMPGGLYSNWLRWPCPESCSLPSWAAWYCSGHLRLEL